MSRIGLKHLLKHWNCAFGILHFAYGIFPVWDHASVVLAGTVSMLKVKGITLKFVLIVLFCIDLYTCQIISQPFPCFLRKSKRTHVKRSHRNQVERASGHGVPMCFSACLYRFPAQWKTWVTS